MKKLLWAGCRLENSKEIEQITIRGNFVIVMGSETIVPAGDQPHAGQNVKRRYTNIWEKQMDEYKLVAPHANVICPYICPSYTKF